MRTGFCRHCKHEIYNDHDYFGYCNMACCSDFAIEQKISLKEAKSLDFAENERDMFEEKISQLECDYRNAADEAEELYQELEEERNKVFKLKTKVEELASIDWEKIKEERKREEAHNMSLIIKMDNIRAKNDNIRENMDKVKRNNSLLLEQNLDLLNTIKEMRSYSDRFNNIDLGIELEYDE